MAASCLMTSCYDLDTQPLSSVLTEEQREEIIEADPEKMDAMSAGVYGNYNGWNLAYANNADFGYPGIILQLECRTADFFSIDIDLYGWFSACAEYLDNTPQSTYNLMRWRVPYNTIYSANQVLSTIAKDTEDDLLKSYRAQAYGNRAFSYWNLAQMYQLTYKGHEQSPCVPLITDENSNEVAADGAPRATVQEIYDQIIADLTEGIRLLTGNSAGGREDKRYVDINVLYALRARAYLCMQEYDKAASDAQTVISSGAFTPLSAGQALLPGFNDLSASNWIWGIFESTESTHGLYTLQGFTGSYQYGYAYVGMWKAISSTLYDQIPNDDCRKLWWINPEDRSSNAQYYTNAVPYSGLNAEQYLEYVEAPDYAVVKFAPYQDKLYQDNNQADVPLIRIEEMYLILAEAQGLGGNLEQGKQTLENFMNNYRWLNPDAPYTCNASSADEFTNEIWKQRRIEFWGEGLNYFDIMRFKKPVDRKNSNWEDPTYKMDSYAFHIPAESAVLVFPIPQTVIDNNPKINDEDQNPIGSASL